MLISFTRFLFNFLIIFVLISLIYSCAPRISRHGNFFSQEELKLLQSTKLNKSEILQIFGQPSTKSTFSDNIWYYIYFIQKEKAYFKVKNTKSTVLKIKFDKSQNVIRYNLIRDDSNIDIKTSIESSSTSSISRGFVRELLNSFVRRMEEP